MAQEQIPQEFMERFKALEREVAALRKATPLKSASIGSGGLRLYGGGSVLVEDGGGIDIADGGRFNAKHPDTTGGDDAFSAGQIRSAADGESIGYGVLVQQADGRDLFSARTDEATGGATVIIRDVNEETMVWTDPVRGGLIYPRLTFHMTPFPAAGWPNTTSSTFATLWHGQARKASPQVRLQIQVGCSGGTTGEARVLVDGVQVGETASSSGTVVTAAVVGDLPTPLDRSTCYIEVQGRVTSGAGSVFASVVMCEQYG